MNILRRVSSVLLSMVLGWGWLIAWAAGPPPADRAAWEALDIVPMPKRIRLTGRRVAMRDGAIFLGAQPTEQDRIGADWINNRFKELGVETLPILFEPQPHKDQRICIYIGTRESCRAIELGAREGRYQLGPNVPGACGYVIEPVERGKRVEVLLGGADPVGALYACVTFAELLEREKDGAFFHEAEISDWPDYEIAVLSWTQVYPELGHHGAAARGAGKNISPEIRRAYLEAMQRYLDRLLRWKVSCFKADDVRYWDQLSPEFMALFREVTDYARKRGIHSLVYALQPFVGKRKDFPDAPMRCLTGTGRSRYEEYIRCWSMDDERRITARRIGEYVKATGLTDVGFHDTDTGSFENPAQWNERCEVCRKRWGDDFAAATINKHRIFYEEIKRAAPDARVHFTLYPYNISVLTQRSAEDYVISQYGPGPGVSESARQLRERFTDFWRRVTAGLPNDVTFCIRETVPENARRFHELTAPHGTFIWYLAGSKEWQCFFDETPRWAPTFYSGRGDVMFTVDMQFFVPIKALAVREYAWNIKAPGAGGWGENSFGQDDPEGKGELYEVVLPHVVRNYFGRAAAPTLTRVFSLNMAYNQIFDHEDIFGGRWKPLLTTYEKMRQQAERAEKGCTLLDELYQRFVASGDRLGMTEEAARRFIYLREVFHCCKWMALAKGQNLLARELAKAGKLEDARRAIAEGREIISLAKADMDKLLQERPEDPIYNAPHDSKGRAPIWKLFTPGNRVDWSIPENQLAATEKGLQALAASGELPEPMRRLLAKRNLIHVPRRVGEIVLDGRLDETEWRRAFPAEAFFVYQEGSVACADTRVHMLHDNATLYVGAACMMPGGAQIRSEPRERDGDLMPDEKFELFIAPPHLNGGHVHFMVNASGSLLDERTTWKVGQAGRKRDRDTSWNAEGVTIRTSRRDGAWEVEMAIPISAIGASSWEGAWRANVCRDFQGGKGVRELSSIQRPGAKDFHDYNFFPVLNFSDTPAPAPEVELSISDFSARTRTFDDRIATVCELGVEVTCGRILRNVRLSAECYDEAGKLHRRELLTKMERICFQWSSSAKYTLVFLHEVKRGGVRLILESDETRAEQWVSLGDWAVGEIFKEGALCAPCKFASELYLPGRAEAIKLFGARKGTIELWCKPQWRATPADMISLSPWHPRHVLLHFGVLRREHPLNFNTSSVVIYHDASSQRLFFTIAAAGYCGWSVSAPFADSEKWRHIACVWDLDAKPADILRLYLDGKRVESPVQVNKPERISKDTGVDVTGYAVQIGSLNTGRHPANSAIRSLRLSRNARYKEAFDPRPAMELDGETTALFPFQSGLEGEGMSPDGVRYSIHASPGVVGY